MELNLKRTTFEGEATIGELSLNGELLCFTLEDKVREPEIPMAWDLKNLPWKIKGHTAVPRGKYLLDLTFSQRFGKVLPLLLNVPGFSGVRIHSGNRPEDTEGCILLGLRKGKGIILESRNAMTLFFEAIAIAKEENGIKTWKLKEDPTWITIT